MYADTAMYDVAVASEYFVNYSRINENLVISNSKGNFETVLGTPGYPYFSKDRLFILSPEQNSLSEWSIEGDKKWEITNISPITDIEASDSGVALGLLDGRVKYIEKSKQLFTYRTRGSKHPVILGCSLSANSNYIGIISGISPNKLTLLKRAGDSFQEIYARDLGTDRRKPVFVDFSPKGRYLLSEDKQSISIYDIEAQQAHAFPVTGDIWYAHTHEDTRRTAVLSRTGKTFSLEVLEMPRSIITRVDWNAETAFLDMKENKLFIGSDGRVFRIDVKEG